MAKGKFSTREEVREEYEKRAGIYEFAVYLYYLVGFPIARYRRLAVEALAPGRGDTIVEIGCGTGMNFPLLQKKVGPEGRIIGVDISGAMLKRADKRINAAGWKNVQLVRSSAADYAFPEGVDGIIATGVLTHEPDYDKVIERGARALAPGKRWVVFDYKMPSGWLRHLVPLFAWVSRPFGISLPLFDRTPRDSIERYLRNVKIQEFYFGLTFIASGEAPSEAP
jgi:demethylmenaquinone methyltransferase/2-methoxy-6-polyprenyl-1,4-benzoquinol methylase